MHDTHDQLFLVEWFCEEVVGTDLETVYKVGRAVERSEEYDGYVGGFFFLL